MKKKSKSPAVRSREEQAKDLCSHNVSTPEYWDISMDAGITECREWFGRASAFVQAMASLDRVVMLRRDEDSNKLYLSSIEQLQ